VLSRPGEDGVTVTRRADAAMYAGKRARRRPARVDLAADGGVRSTLLHEQAAVADLTHAPTPAPVSPAPVSPAPASPAPASPAQD
jgi:hypothetical protein